MRDIEILVIGAGPAGISASLEAATNNVPVVLLDENILPGGQIYRQSQPSLAVINGSKPDRESLKGQQLIEQLKKYNQKIEIVQETTVWNISTESNEVDVLHNNKIEKYRYKKLIIAEGAYDKPMPFPGWTLPGVLTAGGALKMIKTDKVLPGKKMILSGTGPLQLVLAKHLLDAGAKIVAVLEATSPVCFWKNVYRMWGQWELVTDGLQYLFEIKKHKVPLLMSHALVRAEGDKEVTEATYARLDSDWAPIPGTETAVEVDTICSGYGLVPSTRLSRLCGCKHTYEPLLGTWIPQRDGNLESSISGVFAVGDGANIGGAIVAWQEGQIASIKACQQLGYLDPAKAEKLSTRINRRLIGLRRFEHALNEVSAIRKGILNRITDDTVICRCEEVTAGEIRKLATEGFTGIEEIKKLTRAGMGNCQGRMCEWTIMQLLCAERNQPIEEMGYFSSRPPVKPISLGALATEDTER